MLHEFAVLAALWALAAAQGVQVPFRTCSLGTQAPQDQRLDFRSVYAQLDAGQTEQGQLPSSLQNATLKLVGLGNVDTQSTGYSSVTGFLATVITTAHVLSYEIFSNDSALCASITAENGTEGCAYGPGSFGLGMTVPLQDSYPLTAVTTQLRILDTSSPSLELACIEISSTPYYKRYFAYRIFLWFPVALVVVWLVVMLLARLWAAHTTSVLNREAELASSLTARLSPRSLRDELGPIFWDAASGATLQASGALRRFATPGTREVLWAIQFAVMLPMIAVSWPDFAYPMFSQAAWSMLAYNATITQSQGRLVNPLSPLSNESPAAGFVEQMNNPASLLYMDQNLPNVLLDLRGAEPGLASLATAIGLQRTDLFGNAAAIFLAILGFCLIGSALLLGIDSLSHTISKRSPRPATAIHLPKQHMQNGSVTSSFRGSKEFEASTPGPTEEHAYDWTPERPADPGPALNSWWHGDPDASGLPDTVNVAQHARLAVANCTRVLLLFQFPLIIFCVYQISLLHEGASTVSVALAVLLLIAIAVLVPGFLLYKIHQRPVPYLQDDLATMLTYGPLYNTYGERSYGFMGVRFVVTLVEGVFVGAAQSSGLAQAVALLIVEILELFVTCLWLPWGDGAMMGPLSFIFSVSRIVSAVLLIVLSSQVDVSQSVAGWLAYVILVIQAAVIALLFFVLLTKIIELLLRAFGNVPFDEAKSSKAGGLGGALRRWDRSGKRRRKHTRQYAARRSRRSRTSQTLERVNSTGSYADAGDYQTAFAFPTPLDDPDAYAMSTMGHPPRWHQEHLNDLRVGQAIPPGSYSTPVHQRSASYHDATTPEASTSGFRVVRGGKATDTSPYTMTLPAGAARPPTERMHDPRATPPVEYIQHSGRPRARSFTADIEVVDGVARPSPPISGPELFSNAAPGPVARPAQTQGTHTSRKSKASGFFGSLGRRGKPEPTSDDDSDDSDNEDMDEGQRRPLRSLWPFGQKQKPEVEPQEHSFAVVRRPPPRPGALLRHDTDT